MNDNFKITRNGSYSVADNLKYKAALMIERKLSPIWDNLNKTIETGELHTS